MTKIDLTSIEDTIRHLREENERLRIQRDNATHMWEATSENVRELKEEIAKIREVNFEQSVKIALGGAENWELRKQNERLAEALKRAQEREIERLKRNAEFASRIARSGE